MHTHAGDFPKFGRVLLAALLLFFPPSLVRALAQPSLDWAIVDGIGGISANGELAIAATISPEDTTPMSAGNVAVQSLFEPWPAYFTSWPFVPPALRIALATNQVVIRWSAAYPGQQLECAPALLNSGTVWTNVPAAPVNEDGQWTVTLPATGAPRFYRLRLFSD